MKILIVRMMGLGDVACIGAPAARFIRQRFPDARIVFLTYRAGGEYLELIPEVDHVTCLSGDAWPDFFFEGVEAFLSLADRLVGGSFDMVYNFDTWFMPCFMARALKDSGVRVRGNWANKPVVEITKMATSNPQETAKYTRFPARFMASSYPKMPEWTSPWWRRYDMAYPEFYLNHCCGFKGELDMSVDVEPDETLRRDADGRKIIALATSARTGNRNYPYGEDVKAALEAAGAFVWTGFDGSIPMRQTMGRLKITDLTVTISSAPQWLAKAAGCPVLMIPGPVPPETLRADHAVPRQTDCQYCMADHCVMALDYACMNVPPETVVDQAREILGLT